MKKSHFPLLLGSMIFFNSFTDLSAQCFKKNAFCPGPRLDRSSHPLSYYEGPAVVGSALELPYKNYLISSNQCYGGFIAGLEYLKPDHFYANMEILSVFSSPVTVYRKGVLQPSPGWTEFGGFDLRIGYPFTHNNWITSPYLFTPLYSYKSIPRNTGIDTFFLGLGGGVYSFYRLSSELEAGLDIGFFANSNSKRYAPHIRKDFNAWGGKFALPLTWGLSRFDCRVETSLKPFVLVLDFIHGYFVYGASWSLNFRF